MLTKEQLDRYAEILLWGLEISRTGHTNKNDIILVRFHLPAIKLAEVLQAKLLERRRNPILRMVQTPTMEKQFYELADNKQLVFLSPGEEVLAGNLNGSIFLHAPESITHLSHINPEKIGKTAICQKPVKDILNKRDEKGLFSWTLCAYPTAALAEHADLSLAEYKKQLINACFLNKTNPVAHWKEIYQQIASIKEWLCSLSIETIHIRSKQTDLVITPGKKRKWLGLSGHNIPSFEIFLSPDWRGTNGIYYADQPSFRSGNYVKGIRIEFQKGKAVRIQAEKGEAFVRKQLAMDPGAGRIGEFSLTDKRFSKINRFMANTLFDENYGGKHGNCHIALGSSYSNSFSGNPSRLTGAMKTRLGFNDSALHWDIVNTENKQVTATLSSGKKIILYENGRFNK
ncbi:MAG: aminopeptidase [Desulfobacteraceae bacterium]|nr:MAG: aminopeptidase [Desulfobacteraceae bacterium]